MFNNRTFLAIIPARGGSKRLPKKNKLDLSGKPLIVWTIEAGIKSKYIDDVIVTSDDDEILSISIKYGVNTIKRPPDLANDTATTTCVLQHALKYNNKKYDYIVLLQPTSPLRNEKHIDEAIELLESKDAEAIISVTQTEHNPLWSNILPANGDMKNFIKPEIKDMRSQDLPIQYQLNGAIYICKTDLYLKELSFFISNNIYAYKMDRIHSIDIDEEIDLEVAKAYLN